MATSTRRAAPSQVMIRPAPCHGRAWHDRFRARRETWAAHARPRSARLLCSVQLLEAELHFALAERGKTMAFIRRPMTNNGGTKNCLRLESPPAEARSHRPPASVSTPEVRSHLAKGHSVSATPSGMCLVEIIKIVVHSTLSYNYWRASAWSTGRHERRDELWQRYHGGSVVGLDYLREDTKLHGSSDPAIRPV